MFKWFHAGCERSLDVWRVNVDHLQRANRDLASKLEAAMVAYQRLAEENMKTRFDTPKFDVFSVFEEDVESVKDGKFEFLTPQPDDHE